MNQSPVADYRLDIAQLLKQGLSDRAVMRQLRCGRAAVIETRNALGIIRKPREGSGHKMAASAEDAFWANIQAVGDGHFVWAGYVENGTPRLQYGGREGRRRCSPSRVAFRIRAGRNPEGPVAPTCGRGDCVAPDHLDEVKA